MGFTGILLDVRTFLSLTAVGPLAVSPASPSTVYAGTGVGGIFKSTDAGAKLEFSQYWVAGTNVRAIAVDPINPLTVYAATESCVTRALMAVTTGTPWSSILNLQQSL